MGQSGGSEAVSRALVAARSRGRLREMIVEGMMVVTLLIFGLIVMAAYSANLLRKEGFSLYNFFYVVNIMLIIMILITKT